MEGQQGTKSPALLAGTWTPGTEQLLCCCLQLLCTALDLQLWAATKMGKERASPMHGAAVVTH